MLVKRCYPETIPLCGILHLSCSALMLWLNYGWELKFFLLDSGLVLDISCWLCARIVVTQAPTESICGILGVLIEAEGAIR